MMRILKYCLFFAFFTACYFEKDPTKIQAESKAAPARVYQVKVENDKLILNGSRFSGVKEVAIRGNGLNEKFSIVSNTGTRLVLKGLRNVAFGVGKVFDLILSDAYGAATVQVEFELEDKSVHAAKLAPSGALDGDVLVYDEPTETWSPRPVGGSALVGTWDASSNNPALADDGWNTSPSRGDYYIVQTSGSTLIDGNSTWNSGDWIIFDGLDWVRVANTGEVVTFNGRIGAVISQEGDYTADLLGDVDTSTVAPVSGDTLKWNGSNWVPEPPSEGDYSVDQMNDVNISGSPPAVGDVLKWNGSQFVASEDVTGNEAGAVESTAILDNSILNEDINTNANIDQSKIANLPTDLANLNSGITSNASAIAGLDTADVAEDPSRLYFTETRSRGALSANAPMDYDSSTGVISIPKADGLSNGYLSSADWTFFNNKQADLGYTPVDVAGDIMQGNLDFNGNILLNAGSLQIKDNDANYVELRTPANIALNYTLTFPADDGATNQVLTTDGSGVLSWTTPVDTARSSLSASAPLSYNGSTGQFSIGQASGSANGYLSSADWTTFNNKQNALGYTPVNKAGDTMGGALTLSGTPSASLHATTKSYVDTQVGTREPALAGGTTAQYYRGDKTWQTLNTSMVPEGTNQYFTAARARASLSGTAPIAYNSSTGAISISQAGSGSNGFLSAADWNTFNGKLGTSLPSAQLFVGSGANVATARAISGDAILSNTGVVTVDGLQGRAVASTAPSIGDKLTWNGSAWEPGSSGGGGTLTFPDGINGTNKLITVSTGSGYTVPAGKTLYLTSVFKINADANIRIGGRFYGSYSWGRSYDPPVIIGAGQSFDVIDGYGANHSATFTGIEVNAGVTVKTTFVSDTATYTVPAGKSLFIFSWTAQSGGSHIIRFNGADIATFGGWGSQFFPSPVTLPAGTVISCDTAAGCTFNGYER